MRREVDDEQRRTRFDRGIPQREIARRLGIPRSTLQVVYPRIYSTDMDGFRLLGTFSDAG